MTLSLSTMLMGIKWIYMSMELLKMVLIEIPPKRHSLSEMEVMDVNSYLPFV